MGLTVGIAGTTSTYYHSYRVVHHDLLITKLYHIDYKKYTDGRYGSKDMLRGYWNVRHRSSVPFSHSTAVMNNVFFCMRIFDIDSQGH
jgi:hypothetical protein